MTEPTTTPTAPVPPDELKVEWLRIPTPGPVFCMDAPLDAAAAWGYAQALTPRHRNAAMLRAIADEAVPEEPEPPCTGLFYTHKEELSWERWMQRMATRQRLLDAADEAEGMS